MITILDMMKLRFREVKELVPGTKPGSSGARTQTQPSTNPRDPQELGIHLPTAEAPSPAMALGALISLSQMESLNKWEEVGGGLWVMGCVTIQRNVHAITPNWWDHLLPLLWNPDHLCPTLLD